MDNPITINPDIPVWIVSKCLNALICDHNRLQMETTVPYIYQYIHVAHLWCCAS